MIYSEIIKKINEGNKFAIISHIMPDGDCIGSSLALYNVLKDIGKSVDFILDDSIPKIFRFLKGSEEVQRPGEFKTYDAVIALDCGDAGRLGKAESYLGGNCVINIDHHISNSGFGDINLVDPKASATGEIIYKIISKMKIKMDIEISECVYTAIVTDTGRFQYSSTTVVAHQIAGDLINNGVDISLMFDRIYQNNSRGKIMLMKEALSSLEFHHNGNISCISITKEQMAVSNAMEEDSDGLINLARDIENVEVAVFFKEQGPGEIKVGFRSKRTVDVAAVSMQFGGGGHIHAAGCTINGTISEVKDKIINALIDEMNRMS